MSGRKLKTWNIYVGLCVVFSITFLTGCGLQGSTTSAESSVSSQSDSAAGGNSAVETDENASDSAAGDSYSDLEIPVDQVDFNSLPQGSFGSTAYDIGVQQAEEFIYTSALTRAMYSTLGGLEQSCKVILESFMAYEGGNSTLQQYADFLYGCKTVVRDWY